MTAAAAARVCLIESNYNLTIIIVCWLPWLAPFFALQAHL